MLFPGSDIKFVFINIFLHPLLLSRITGLVFKINEDYLSVFDIPVPVEQGFSSFIYLPLEKRYLMVTDKMSCIYCHVA